MQSEDALIHDDANFGQPCSIIVSCVSLSNHHAHDKSTTFLR